MGVHWAPLLQRCFGCFRSPYPKGTAILEAGSGCVAALRCECLSLTAAERLDYKAFFAMYKSRPGC